MHISNINIDSSIIELITYLRNLGKNKGHRNKRNSSFLETRDDRPYNIKFTCKTKNIENCYSYLTSCESYRICDALSIDRNFCKSTRNKPNIIMNQSMLNLCFFLSMRKRSLLYFFYHCIYLLHRESFFRIGANILGRHRIIDTDSWRKCKNNIFWNLSRISTHFINSFLYSNSNSLHICDRSIKEIFAILTHTHRCLMDEMSII